MSKYTIKKAFEKHYPFPIWKIEVDCAINCLAIEFRNPDTTTPSFTVVDFDGNTLLENYTPDEKEWTLESIQGDFLILKRIGSTSPIQAGIQIFDIPSQRVICVHMEYVLKEVYINRLKVTHRSIPAGFDYYIDISTGKVSSNGVKETQLPQNLVSYPIAYQGRLPEFIQLLSFEDQIWLQPHNDIFIWSYHIKTTHSLDLHLCLSSKTEILDSKIVLNNLDKLIPQPYFKVKDYIFFLSNTKQEIAAYLV